MKLLALGPSHVIATVTFALSSPSDSGPVGSLSSALASTSAPLPPMDSYVHVEIPMQPFSRYVQEAVDIVRVTITGVEHLPYDYSMPLTAYRAQVLESIKGVASGEIEVRVAGGEGADGSIT